MFLYIALKDTAPMPVLVCYKNEYDVLQEVDKEITITYGNFIENNKHYYTYSALFGPELNGYWINKDDNEYKEPTK